MDVNIRPSFIPKTPITDVTPQETKKSFGVMTALVLILIAGTVISYLYVSMQLKNIKTVHDTYVARIEKARNEIGVDFVSDMVSLQAKIESAQELLGKHVAVSPIFKAIQETTVQKVHYKDFNYSLETNNELLETMVVVKMNGVAPDYKTIALQADALAQNTFIKDPIISDIKNDNVTNTVSFLLEFKVSLEDVSYQKSIES